MLKSDFHMGHAEIWFLFTSASMISRNFCLVNLYRNTISEWAVVIRYENFFIPWVENSSKISPRAKNLVLQRAVGPREARFFSQCWDEEISIPENRPIRKSYISIRCLHGFMSNLIKKSWTDSSTGCFNSKPDVLKWSCDLDSKLLVFWLSLVWFWVVEIYSWSTTWNFLTSDSLSSLR